VINKLNLTFQYLLIKQYKLQQNEIVSPRKNKSQKKKSQF